MRYKGVLKFLIPALPLLCLAMLLMVLVFDLETNQKIMQVTVTPIPNSTSGTANPQSTVVAVPSSTSTPALSAIRPEVLTAVKDLGLVVASGIITLTSAYLGASVQSAIKREEEERSTRKLQVQPYKEYLYWVMQIGQKAGWVRRFPQIKAKIKVSGTQYEINSNTISQVLENMPLAWELSALDDKDARLAFDEAMNTCINFLMDLQSNKPIDAAKYEVVRIKYIAAIKALNKFENS